MATKHHRTDPTPLHVLAAIPIGCIRCKSENGLKLTIDHDVSEPGSDIALKYTITYGRGYVHCEALWYREQEWQIIAEGTRYEGDGQDPMNPIHTLEIIPRYQPVTND